MSSSNSDSESASNLLKKTNEINTMLKRLNSNVQLYNQVQSLQKNVNDLEERCKSLNENIKTSICKDQCKKLNETKDPNSIDEFLIHLILSKDNAASIPETTTTPGTSTPFFVTASNNQASAPPL
jgi:predicted nuclease with TOPRIM domain